MNQQEQFSFFHGEIQRMIHRTPLKHLVGQHRSGDQRNFVSPNSASNHSANVSFRRHPPHQTLFRHMASW